MAARGIRRPRMHRPDAHRIRRRYLPSRRQALSSRSVLTSCQSHALQPLHLEGGVSTPCSSPVGCLSHPTLRRLLWSDYCLAELVSMVGRTFRAGLSTEEPAPKLIAGELHGIDRACSKASVTDWANAEHVGPVQVIQ